MSFKFNWPRFSDDMYATVRAELTSALNAGERHPSLADDIVASDVFFGTMPPKLEILEVSEMSEDRFKATFKVQYEGDGYIELSTKAQANPVKPSTGRPARSGRVRAGILAANKPLIVPIRVRISSLCLDGIAVLDMHKTRGVSLSFKNDPFKSVKINTSFDENPAIADMLQTSLEQELRELFNTGIPELVHKLSLQHIDAESKVQAAKEKKRRSKTTHGRAVQSMPTSPELKRHTSLQPGSLTRPSSSVKLSRYDSAPYENDMGTVGAQLATHSYQQSTLSPFSMNAEHVTHRTAALATSAPPDTCAFISSPLPDATKAPAASFAAPLLLASPSMGLNHLARPASPLTTRRTTKLKAQPTQGQATIVSQHVEGEFTFDIPTFNATTAMEFLADRSAARRLYGQLVDGKTAAPVPSGGRSGTLPHREMLERRVSLD